MVVADEKIIETKICPQCQSSFDITDKDREFYDKVSPVFGEKKYTLPTPTLCPDCRQQRRLAQINQYYLYKNTCGLCQQSIVSRFQPESGIINYCNECWASDGWDSLSYGQEMDFNRSLFEQVGELIQNTPFQSLIGSLSNIENNAEYTNHTSEIHNSYLVTEANTIEQSYYCAHIKNSHDLMDSSFVGNSEYSYECIDCYNMYKAYFCQQSTGCRDSYFLYNCTNCDHCIGCYNLDGKSYHIGNKPVSIQEYKDLVSRLGDREARDAFAQQYYKEGKTQIYKQDNIVGSQDCRGNNIIHSSNCLDSFDVLECQDCRYSSAINYSNDLYDVSSYGEKSSLMYESVSVGRYSNNILFSNTVGKGEHLIYCIDVKKSHHCFACVNLKDAQYCILNRQYTRDEYEILVPKIIEHMTKTGEWGEFFPANLSPFGYNETIAQQYFPLTREEVLFAFAHPLLNKEGETNRVSGGGLFNWSDYENPAPKVDKTIPADKLPNIITEIPDDILDWAIKCEVTQKPFRIIPEELKFYRKHNLPIPRRHPDQRHLDRIALRNPRKLFERDCDKCSKSMQTTYAPEGPERVYCEKCYNTEIY